MKSTRKSTHNIRSRAISIAVCIALILCAVLSFGLFFTDRKTAAEADSEVGGIRFVQVAAGEDFAIGLTYDNKLYGWSLNDNSQGGVTSTTLGDYYSSTPTQIDVVFRQGPGSTKEWKDADYHSDESVADFTIKQIVATRYSAAFITSTGYIYTWGRDTGSYIDVTITTNADVPHPLLLRNIDDSTYSNPWYIPYIIDYNYHANSNIGSSTNALPAIRPALTNASIAAGEYNYIITFSTGSNVGYTGSQATRFSFVWGSRMFNVVNTESNGPYQYHTNTGSDISNNANIRVYATSTEYANDAVVTAVAGGHTVGMYGGSAGNGVTTLMLRGDNFLNNSDDFNIDASNNVLSFVKDGKSGATTELTAASGSANIRFFTGTNTSNTDPSVVMSGAIAGAGGSTATVGATNSILTGNANYQVYGQQASGVTDGITYGNNTSIDNKIRLSDGTTPESSAFLIHYGVSLGNDVGYGVSDGGALYAWGDNSAKQLATASTAKNEVNPKPLTVTGVTTGFISVAAGKQRSSKRVAFYDNNVSNPILDITKDGGGTITGAAFAEDADNKILVANDDAFITGALTADGRLFVWSDGVTKSDGATKIEEIVFGEKNSDNKLSRFAAIYSGYGHNLFAVTRLGKVVRISVDDGMYKQTVYDTFVNLGSTATVENWSVAYTESGNTKNIENSIKFDVTDEMIAADPKAPALGSITLFVDNAYSDQASVFLNGNANSASTTTDRGVLEYKTGSKGNPLVKANAIGDSYRILSDEIDETKTFIATTGHAEQNITDKTVVDGKHIFKPVFYFNGVKMEDMQQRNMFSYEFVYENETVNTSETSSAYAGRVGIKISPKQSSQKGTITVEFYVARYDSAINFACTSEDDVTDNAVYYDYKKCAVQFTIEDTPTYRKIEQFRSADGNSEIPLLDPNNEYNKYYSIALQDVSGGVEALIKYLRGESDNDAYSVDKANDDIYTAILAAMSDTEKGDKGFPLSTKADNGNLDYYLGNNVKNLYYTDTYKYIFADRDADLIIMAESSDLSPGERAITANASGALYGSVSGDVGHIEIKDITLPSGLDSKLIANIDTDFNNKFGLYDLSIADGKLSFKYDVVMFTAKDGTGNLDYNTMGDSASVSAYKTDSNGSFMGFDITAKSFGGYAYNADGVYAPVRRDAEILYSLSSDVAAVYSQPSVRFNYGGATYYGDADAGKNELVIKMPVSRVGETIEIPLENYIDITGGDICYSVNDKASGYDSFNNQWSDKTGSSIKVVELSGSMLTVRPTETHGIYITVTVQRFFESMQKTFGDDEKIKISFVFDSFNDFTLTAVGSLPTFAIPSQGGIFDLFGGTTAINNGTGLIDLMPGDTYRNNMRMVSVASTNTGVVTVSKASESTFSVTPVNSGSSVINVVIKVFGKPVLVTLHVNVAGVTQISGDLKLNDVVSVYINSMVTEIQRNNGFISNVKDYGILYNDLDANGRPNAVVFYDTDGNKIDGYPSYVGKVTFIDTDTSNPRLRIEINNDTTDTKGRYIMHVRFVNKNSGLTTYAEHESAGMTVLETAQGIRSTKLIVATSNDDPSILTIDVDCDAPKTVDSNSQYSDWWTTGQNTKMQVHIPVRYLLEKAGSPEPDAYKIFLVSAELGANKYFNYKTDAVGAFVLIDPLYDTPNAFTISVSVAPKSLNPNGDNVNQILSFRVTTKGISTTLPKQTYTTIWLVAFFASLGLLMIIFLIRMIVYWRRRAKQRQLIKRNQELIRMRDRVHNKANAATRDQLVKSKMKMEDPKYAKMYNDMRKAQRGDSMGVNSMGINSTGVILENMSQPGEDVDKKGKKKKKKGGKKSIAELKAELEAKKAAFAQAQNGEPVASYGADMGMQGGADAFGQPYGAPNGGFGSPADAYAAPDIDNAIIFDVDDGSQG